ncbi:YdiU family protein [Ponticoccus sp. SC2-23]|uniref:protein adenylyltransferase SelO n=1 Tax=Alexandriicola marinus TaxID=2081710 RepID=UPI000FDC779C|nr:YdiU family protein [Alexandriicola marinus]MBM1222315.1 YdiU family protein [Ponticoccus sp. SC6-9]MBM1224428.1 YdiU family protein [Ponticoccus sp. SC6-15]MBM1229792.1 YdiU family protein [Ponticoccus sp. SC6-38]MBM1233394.1 YdiU family protein [Ponticoccus sp. SC6-45]MBM1236656.1 YdiU family protein [Ponticoccus sp. SC6-49]MBM1244700.1 YdiU family protein [Ponticoccus sp. SC2-64]MBM1246918.1 YdiU family protein [Ponticoccus sp. SC6-42]MBM1251396.1 YdiU family protein [Ponticoccus sp. 
MTALTAFRFDNSYARELDGFYVPWEGAAAPAPRIVRLNTGLAQELGLDPDALATEDGAAILAGAKAPDGATPLAQAYAGHQFGGFSPQLGDGRALLLGEVLDRNGQRRDIHLKGSGRTPFSRGGDGKAAVGPVLREYLVGEAMHALGVPSTRALGAVLTGEMVMRETMLPGAVLARVASSHLRVGTFEYFAARRETDKLAQLTGYALARHYPDLAHGDTPALSLFRAVRDRQARLIAQWMGLGFVHGVMNTDNMTISGETIDYGPCAFIDTYRAASVFSSIDRQGRYAYRNQPGIGQWNLARLAEALLPLLADDPDDAIALVTPELEAYGPAYEAAYSEVFTAKLGLQGASAQDAALVTDLLAAMEAGGADFTRTFRFLAADLRNGTDLTASLFSDRTALDAWRPRWMARLGDARATADAMDRVNPLYIPRNHLVEEALGAATNDADFAPFEDLLSIVTRPFEAQPGKDRFALPAPEDFGPYTTFCGT